MNFRKTNIAVGVLLALGLGVGTAEQAAAGSGCGNMAGSHDQPYGGMMGWPHAYGYGNAPMPARMMRPMPAHAAMYWGAEQPKVIKVATAGDAPGDIVEVAVAAGSFKTLATALQAAGLVETLQGDGPFTVFAPTDEAFAKIPRDQLDALLADKDKLTAVLTYHVVAGKVMAEDVVGLDNATTLQGSDLTIDTSDGVKVDGATVVKTDVEASNGVIHVIDTVLMPK